MNQNEDKAVPNDPSTATTDARQAEALDTLNKWFSGRGHDVSGSSADAWNSSPYKDAFIFSSGQGRRSNTLYLVRGLSVFQMSGGFGPSVKDAYLALGGAE